MPHPIATYTRPRLAALRALTRSDQILSDERLSEGIYPSWDTGEGDLTLQAHSEPGIMLRLTPDIRRAPRWFSLNIDLGPGPMAAGDVLAILAQTSGATQTEQPPFIRSSQGGTQADTPLSEPFLHDGRPKALLFDIGPGDALTWDQAFHTLVIPLSGAEFIVQDLDITVLRAGTGLRAGPVTLASYGEGRA